MSGRRMLIHKMKVPHWKKYSCNPDRMRLHAMHCLKWMYGSAELLMTLQNEIMSATWKNGIIKHEKSQTIVCLGKSLPQLRSVMPFMTFVGVQWKLLFDQHIRKLRLGQMPLVINGEPPPMNWSLLAPASSSRKLSSATGLLVGEVLYLGLCWPIYIIPPISVTKISL